VLYDTRCKCDAMLGCHRDSGTAGGVCIDSQGGPRNQRPGEAFYLPPFIWQDCHARRIAREEWPRRCSWMQEHGAALMLGHMYTYQIRVKTMPPLYRLPGYAAIHGRSRKRNIDSCVVHSDQKCDGAC
jgi:hypothetical protein